MAQTFTHLLTDVIFSTKERRPVLKVEIRPRLFSYAPAGLTRFGVFLPRVPLRSTLGYNPTAALRLPSPRLRISTTLTLVACALCIAPVPAAAQSITGAIVGRVTDPSDAVIVGASVRAINAANGAVDAAATDNTGFYRIANLVPGEYFVQVEAAGFQKTRLSAQRLSLADNLRLDVKLELGETEFSVTVADLASEVNTEDAQLGTPNWAR